MLRLLLIYLCALALLPAGVLAQQDSIVTSPCDSVTSERIRRLFWLHNPTDRGDSINYVSLHYKDDTKTNFLVNCKGLFNNINKVDSIIVMAGHMNELIWSYGLADSASKYDTVMLFAGNHYGDSLFTKQKIPLLETTTERIRRLSKILYFPNVINALPGKIDKRENYYLQVYLFKKNLTFDMKEAKGYGNVLAAVIFEYVMNKSDKVFKGIIIRYIGEDNMSYNSYIYNTSILVNAKY